MMDQPPLQYRRVPGIRRISFGYETLHLGPDHLLSVRGRGWAEGYKRFYYRDIQAIITRKTSIGMAQNIACGLLAALFMIPGIFGDDVEFWVWLIPAGIFLLLLFINWWRGPTCICHIQTAVQTDKLPSLHRLKTAAKAIEVIRSYIVTTQGPLTQEQLDSLVREAGPRKTKGATGQFGDKSVSRGNMLHLFLFILLLIDAMFWFLGLMKINQAGLTMVGMFVGLALAALTAATLVTQYRTGLVSRLNALTWGAAGYVGFNLVYGYLLFIYASIKNPAASGNQWKLLKTVSEITAKDISYLPRVRLLFLLAALTLAVLGLIVWWLSRRIKTASTPTKVPPVPPINQLRPYN
ncbi:MAG: hypothetical protein HQK55_13955 [Deltaproteobacteria bacterium]|nr:hypothetical protein [Deltaproteobacteria bacterium]